MNVAVRALAAALVARGVAVDLFTRDHGPCRGGAIDAGPPGLRVFHVAAGPRRVLPPAEVVPHLAAFSRGVLTIGDEGPARYTVLHAHYWLSGLVADELSRAWGVPIVQRFHSLGAMKAAGVEGRAHPTSVLRRDAERALARGAHRLLAATPGERAELLEHCAAEARRVRIVPLGVDLQRFSPRPRARASTDEVLFAGRVDPIKGLTTLLEAFAVLRERAPETYGRARLSIVGGADSSAPGELTRARRLSATLDLEARVTFWGPQAHADLAQWYAKASGVVVPSFHESFGLVALEAMASGAAVIASDVGGLSALIRHNHDGIKVQPGRPVELASRLEEILNDRPRRLALGAQARQRALQFSWPRIAERIVEVYGELAVRDPRALHAERGEVWPRVNAG
jgi:D-inositol-3-phosphate glycosyltransferase